MKPEDCFLKRIPDLHDVTTAWDTSFKFGTEPNKKTFGLLLVRIYYVLLVIHFCFDLVHVVYSLVQFSHYNSTMK